MTIGIGFVGATALGMTANQATFVGFLLALSSTAIVVKLLQQRAEAESPHGRLTLGILIFQDLAVVPMMLIAPVLAGGSEHLPDQLLVLAAKVTGLFVVVVLAAKWVFPFALHRLAQLRSRELFLLGIVSGALAVAWLTSAAGLSLALGAFLAGLIISESEYSHYALANMLPFRDLFASFFFVSVGMLLDLPFVWHNPVPLVAMASCVLLVKFVTAGCSALILGFPLRAATLTGLALCQIGEFSFVLSQSGAAAGLMEPHVYQFFLGVSVATMVATPFLVSSGGRLSDAVLQLPWPLRLQSGYRPAPAKGERSELRNHLIIVGFGLGGRHLSQAAAAAKIPRVIIELNPETVRRERGLGQPIFFGDASHESVLEHAGIGQARVLVIVISDPAATRRIINAARLLKPDIHIIARTRFVSEMEPLYELGANEVIPEDYEASLELLARVLTKYLVPRDEVEQFIGQVRAGHYHMLRTPPDATPTVCDLSLHLSDMEVTTLRVLPESSIDGKSLSRLDLRNTYGVTVLAIRRESELLANPPASEVLRADDVVVLLGKPDAMSGIYGLFQKPRDANAPSNRHEP
jgi:CPA2 family monovalent cation:H+ antiporter-2